MKRVVSIAALAATAVVGAAPHAQAVEVCYNNGGGCVYTSGSNVCWTERGSNGATQTYCVGPNGVSQCFTDVHGTTCNRIP